MHFSETRSAVVLVLAMGVACGPVFAADLDASGDKPGFFGASPILLAATEGGASPETTSGEPVSEGSKDTALSSESSAVEAASVAGMANVPVPGAEAASSVQQQSVTAGYELGGWSLASQRRPTSGSILTAPAKGQPVRFENGIAVHPSVLLGGGYNDNVTNRTNNKVSSSILVLRPELVAELRNQDNRYTLSYQGNYGHYASSSDDDYQHHEVWAAGDNYLTSRTRIGWGVGYLERTDPRGSTDRVGAETPDRWHAPVVRALGIYGAPGSIGRIELEGSSMQKRYDNNRASTVAYDADLSTVSGRFFYRFMPKTSLLVEARNTWANYKLSTSTADNTDLRLYAGIAWDVTAKTMGSIKLGRAYKKFDDASREDSSMASWEGGLRWSPITYSTFDLVTSRSPSEATGFGNFVLNSATTLVWSHRWASYFSSRVNAGYIKSEYDNTARTDHITNYGVGVFRELGRRMRAGVDWNFSERDSNQVGFDFKRNVMMLTLEASL